MSCNTTVKSREFSYFQRHPAMQDLLLWLFNNLSPTQSECAMDCYEVVGRDSIKVTGDTQASLNNASSLFAF